MMINLKKKRKLIFFICIASITLFIGYQFYLYNKNQGNYIIYVTNQSEIIDPIDIEIRINNEVLINDKFFVKNFHNFKRYAFTLPLGKNQITLISKKTGVKYDYSINLFCVRWSLIEYFDLENETEKEDSLNFEISNYFWQPII